MSEFASNSFSTIGTSTKLSPDKLSIKKYIKHQCCSQDVALDLYSSYISSLSASSFSHPTSVYPLDLGVCLDQNLYGHKLFTPNNEIDFDYIFYILPQIISLFAFAFDNKIYLDPHLSNFHVSNDEIRLIDFSPPYSIAYNYYVNRKCVSNTERFFLMKNCLFFRWNYLPYHFVGDLSEITDSSSFHLPTLYQFFKPLLPRSVFFSEFVEISFMIRHHENLRSRLKFNLL